MLHLPAPPAIGAALAAAVAVLASAALPSAALAETIVGNDEIGGATLIPVPYSAEQDTDGARPGDDDPQTCWSGGFSVWYELVSPRTGTLRITDFVSRINPETGSKMDADSGVAVFTGSQDALVERGCHFMRQRDGGGSVDVFVSARERLWVLAGSSLADSTGTAVLLDVRYLRSCRARPRSPASMR